MTDMVPIYGFGGSGSVKIKIVSGTSAPESAARNTLWVQTGTSVTDYALSPVSPALPVEGAVWLRTDGDGVNFYLDQKQRICFHICGAFQYVVGAWKSVSVSLRTGGAWKSLANARYNLFLSGKGLQNGHTLSVVDCSNGQFGVSDKIYLSNEYYANGGHQGANVTFLPSIDLTGYRTLHLSLSVTANGDAPFIAGVGPDPIPDNGVDGWPSGTLSAAYEIQSGKSFSGVMDVDISGVSGYNYVKIRGYRSFGYINNVWLD